MEVEGSGKSAEENLPWVEKYRPTDLSQVVGNEDAIQRLQVIAVDGNMPHLLLSGPPGTGKTTSVLCLAHALLGSSFKEGVLELNASDDRGIDVVRTKIKMFAQKKVTLPNGRHKIIILDEADSMTDAAQQALRRTMEIYSSTTRFALACNMSSNIIEPIQSRCAILRYTRLADEQVLAKLLEICQNEGVAYTMEGLEAIIFTAEGDMRQAINNLQSTHAGMGLVDADNVFKICDQPHPKIVRSIIQNCLSGNLDEAIGTLMGNLWSQGYSSLDIIGTFFGTVRGYDMPEYTKLEYIKEIGTTHMRIAEGVSSPLQLTALLARLVLVSQHANA